MTKAPPGRIRYLATETFVIKGRTYYHQYMDCNCGALFFRPSKQLPAELKCPGCDKTFQIMRKKR